MVRITDITLSCIDILSHNKANLLRFLNFLIEAEVDAIELSPRMYQLLSPLPKYAAYTIPHSQARLTGLDDALCGNYLHTFAQAKESFNEDVEFCPGNRGYCATALAAEWVISGTGNNVASSFGGIGGFAATEELIMIFRLNGLRKADKTYPFLPEMSRLFKKITGKKVRPNKPVIGKRIFNVESGIHVDGILKQPECYEPFPPEIVGRRRKIVLGKQSGTASIHAKLAELDMQCAEEHIPLVLEQVKAKAVKKNRAITKREFAIIVKDLTQRHEVTKAQRKEKNK
jgi:homocitrate synthase NifV